ncbi:MAG: hypothetical protein MJH10_09610 [Epibacterium sp.]|nr:hypothetical protein [Epibacterium sp.]NQX73791.1 hypothetical protein [Epibacterium sp.]
MEQNTEEMMTIPKPKFEVGDKVVNWDWGMCGRTTHRHYDEEDGWTYVLNDGSLATPERHLELYHDPESVKGILFIEAVSEAKDYRECCRDYGLGKNDADSLDLISKDLAEAGLTVVLGVIRPIGGGR